MIEGNTYGSYRHNAMALLYTSSQIGNEYFNEIDADVTHSTLTARFIFDKSLNAITVYLNNNNDSVARIREHHFIFGY